MQRASVFELNDVTVGVVHVPRSPSRPHFIKATGEVDERGNGQTRRMPAGRVRQMLTGGGASHEAALVRFDRRDDAIDVAVDNDTRLRQLINGFRLAAVVLGVEVLALALLVSGKIE